MKMRTGFVSNSSSSSFICDVTGEDVSGRDMCLSDAGMCECENGHTFLDEYLVGEVDEDNDGWRYEVTGENCPICSMTHNSSADLKAYLSKTTEYKPSAIFAEIKAENKRRRVMRDHEYVSRVCNKLGKSKGDINTEIKTKFKTYTDFLKFLEA